MRYFTVLSFVNSIYPNLFEQDLEHLKDYLHIEKLRFPQIEIHYDLECVDFCLPALTLQPIVENSIKHGVRERIDGGWVRISTKQDEAIWYLTISDNGIGFDVGEPQKPGRSHIGIANTRSRLKSMCNGELMIESKLGSGTKVMIRIPKEEQK